MIVGIYDKIQGEYQGCPAETLIETIISVFGLIKITTSQFSAYIIPSPRRVELDPSSVHVTSPNLFLPPPFLEREKDSKRLKKTQKDSKGLS
jgi:hypothetical protein